MTVLDPRVKITTNHDEIIKWANKHGGFPTIFDDPTAREDKVGLRLDFQGKRDEKYMNEAIIGKHVVWEDFFELFEKIDLAFMYRTEDEPEDITLAYKLIPRSFIKL